MNPVPGMPASKPGPPPELELPEEIVPLLLPVLLPVLPLLPPLPLLLPLPLPLLPPVPLLLLLLFPLLPLEPPLLPLDPLLLLEPPHGPQSRVEPQPSLMVPQLAFCAAQVVGAQVPVPQRFAPPPPHVSPEAHEPQSTLPPQPSGIKPQFFPASAHVVRTQETLEARPEKLLLFEPHAATRPKVAKSTVLLIAAMLLPRCIEVILLGCFW